MAATINDVPVHVTLHVDDTNTKVRATVDEIFTGNVLMETDWHAAGSDSLEHWKQVHEFVFNEALAWMQEHMDKSA